MNVFLNVILCVFFLISCSNDTEHLPTFHNGTDLTDAEESKVEVKANSKNVLVSNEREKTKDTKKGPEAEKSQDPEPSISESEQIVDICQSGSSYVITQTISFPERVGCAFGKNGNAAAEQGVFAARFREVKPVGIPTGAIVCSISVDAQQNEFRYDDSIVMTMENAIILARDKTMLNYLPEKKNLKVWDFDLLKGLNRSFDTGEVFCLGDGDCTLPDSEESGKITFDIPPKSLAKIAVDLVEKESFNISLITTGDNDEDVDCGHSALDLDISVEFAVQ